MPLVKEALADSVARACALVTRVGRPCAVIGGAAMILRVRPRPTADVAIVIEAKESDVEDILVAAREVGYALADNAMAMELARAGLVQLVGPGGREESRGADLIFVDSKYLGQVVARATPVGNVTLPVATV